MQTIELLSPAKNLAVGIAAINHGADAVYIGAPAFGARSAASNSLQDITELVQYAHQFNVKVYITFNILLYDNELPKAIDLIHKLYKIGVDALIIQDMALLECELPPIPLHASTQLNNRTTEKVKFLQDIGFEQVVLARETSIEQIKNIRKSTTIPLEYFIHGALCVCYSGQCYMSEYAVGRSGNRGECSQMCRHKYTIQGIDTEQEGYFISTKDLSLESKIEELISAGISSFKIEGRLKDEDYVKNVTAFYRQKIDEIIARNPHLQRSSRGTEIIDFTPSLSKTFSRGFTTYFTEKRQNKVANIRSPKSQGEYLGKVLSVQGTPTQRGRNSITIGTKAILHNGDGLCFYDKNNELAGVQINAVNNKTVTLNKTIQLPVGTDIWRNFDIEFQKQLERSKHARKLPIFIEIFTNSTTLITRFSDYYNNSISIGHQSTEVAKNQPRQKEMLISQMSKLGDSMFSLSQIEIKSAELPFITTSEINEIRRNACELLRTKIIENHPIKQVHINKNSIQFPLTEPTDFRLNVANQKAKEFYERHGVQVQQMAYELGHHVGIPLMTTKHCIRYQLGACKKGNAEPIFMHDKSHKFRIEFDCNKCEMNIFAEQ